MRCLQWSKPTNPKLKTQDYLLLILFTCEFHSISSKRPLLCWLKLSTFSLDFNNMHVISKNITSAEELDYNLSGSQWNFKWDKLIINRQQSCLDLSLESSSFEPCASSLFLRLDHIIKDLIGTLEIETSVKALYLLILNQEDIW